jgi:RimJ/RimL family protein N-acetyltransferase
MITYIVSVYFGKRRSKTYNRFWDVDIYYFVKQHIRMINKYNNPDINKILFVVNHYNHMIDQEILNVVKELDNKVPVEVIFRSNQNFSYGAWNDAIKHIIDTKTDYYFLIEDDYLPNFDKFYEPFVSQMDQSTGYVAQLVNYNYNPVHASISNGLLSYEAAKDSYDTFGDIFKLSKASSTLDDLDYQVATTDQINFLCNILEKYQIKDVSAITKIPFLESVNDCNTPDQVIYFGNTKSPIVIIPGQMPENLFNFRLIKDTDAEFVSGIRNMYAKQYLHDSRIFTVDETKKWIKTTNPEFYIIEYLNRPIGYFRTSNYSKENDSIYIGCDISSEFTGQGLGYLSYLKFLGFIFEKYNLNKVTLEVLVTNLRAINLYKKLGFVYEGLKRQDVKREDKYIDSEIYSLLKSEFYK